MRLLSVTTYAYLPAGFGGSALSTHDMCLALLERGVRPTVLVRAHKDLARVLRRNRKDAVADAAFGYDIVRAIDAVGYIDRVVDSFDPTVAVVQSGRQIECVKRLIARGVPTIVYVRDVEFDRLSEPYFTHPLVSYVANSDFTAQAVRRRAGIECAVIPPIVRRASYATESARTHIVFINPKPEKGVDLVLAVARRLRERAFLIVEAWPLSRWERLKLTIAARMCKNIVLRKPALDMREVYRHARLLLVPSRWSEAWGRIVTEAHCSGIPVIATDIGGLPEAVGQGGILIAPDAGAEAWANAVELLWNDAAVYAGYVQAARTSAERPEIDENVLTERLLAVLSAAQQGRAFRPLRFRAARRF